MNDKNSSFEMHRFNLSLVHPFPKELWSGAVPRSREISCLYVDSYEGPRIHEGTESHAYWEMVGIVRGTGRSVGEREIDLKPGMVLLIPPGVVHGEVSQCADFGTIWAGFDWVQPSPDQKNVLWLEDRDLLTRIEELWIFSREQGKRIGPELDAIMASLAHRFLRVREESESSGGGDFDVRAIRFIESHYREPVPIPKLARFLGCSEGYLHRCFRKQTGLAPNDYIKKLRIRQAAFLLKNTDLPIAAVAEKVGYPNAYYFSRVFSQITGHSPREHRRTGFPHSRDGL